MNITASQIKSANATYITQDQTNFTIETRYTKSISARSDLFLSHLPVYIFCLRADILAICTLCNFGSESRKGLYPNTVLGVYSQIIHY